MTIRLLDTFAGIGGFHLALERSIGKDNIKCIGFSEIDKSAKEVYKRRFPESKDLGSISELDINNLEDFDILTGGFPCQDISGIGKRDLSLGRTALVEYLLRILEVKQPKYFIFENVKGLMGKKFTEFREGVFERIDLSGYDLHTKILNTKDFGIPQNRERVFMVGVRKDLQENYEFPIGGLSSKTLLEFLDNKVDSLYDINEGVLEKIGNRKSFENPLNTLKRQEVCKTLTARGQCDLHAGLHLIKREQGITKLTEEEVCRLQGFPDNWNDNVPRKQRHKQAGNAITVNVVEALFNNLLNKKDVTK